MITQSTQTGGHYIPESDPNIAAAAATSATRGLKDDDVKTSLVRKIVEQYYSEDRPMSSEKKLTNAIELEQKVLALVEKNEVLEAKTKLAAGEELTEEEKKNYKMWIRTVAVVLVPAPRVQCHLNQQFK
ncbi:hypothetical protein QAD02_024094 [Eretmocerus hayati]|uniref:Uncharacterized protein n=1 Tax=Eretmocerus hayati TaxID=131215 RepID=A0ACC2PXE8_9HYME|nr:hypothetical protein QAD02_024094 [Eretmocerus hayati]